MLPRKVGRKGKSFQAKADGFGEIVEGSKLLGVEGRKRVRLKRDDRGPGPWKNLGAVLGNLDLISWLVGALIVCGAKVGHQIAFWDCWGPGENDRYRVAND